jgi:hypothetical protein
MLNKLRIFTDLFCLIFVPGDGLFLISFRDLGMDVPNFLNFFWERMGSLLLFRKA